MTLTHDLDIKARPSPLKVSYKSSSSESSCPLMKEAFFSSSVVSSLPADVHLLRDFAPWVRPRPVGELPEGRVLQCARADCQKFGEELLRIVLASSHFVFTCKSNDADSVILWTNYRGEIITSSKLLCPMSVVF